MEVELQLIGTLVPVLTLWMKFAAKVLRPIFRIVAMIHQMIAEAPRELVSNAIDNDEDK